MPAKKIVQDIVPTGKRTIRNIPLEDRGEEGVYEETPIIQKPSQKKPIEIRRIVEEPKIEEISEDAIEPISIRQPGSKQKKRSSKFLIGFIIIFLGIAVIAGALSLTYSKAVVTITPKVVDFDINGTFTAKKDAVGTDLSYEVVTITEEEKDTLPATKGATVETKASGKVVIYNNYSTTAQTLVAGTRLATDDSLIYRTTSTITVPGKKTTPGSIEVEVVADQVGESYNKTISSLKGDFKIVAFKGTDRYNAFYARLKTDIDGGFKGTKTVVEESTKANSVKAIEDSLKTKILAKIEATVPSDYVVYDNSYTINYEVPEPIMLDESNAQITVKATANVPIFKSDSLIKYIAGNEIRKFPSDTYDIKGEEKLDFKISNSKDFSAQKGTPLIFTLKGPVSIVGTFSEDQLKKELTGISLAESNAIFAKYSAISNAYALITPFWLRAFPNTVDRILIEYK